MVFRRLIQLVCIQLTVVIFLGACGAEQNADPSQDPSDYPTPKPTVIAREVFRTSGEGAGIAEKTFTLTEKTRILANWDQSSEDLFILKVFQLDSDPELWVIFEYVIGPSSGSGEFEFAPGEYSINVENGDGPWEVWLQEIILEE